MIGYIGANTSEPVDGKSFQEDNIYSLPDDTNSTAKNLGVTTNPLPAEPTYFELESAQPKNENPNTVPNYFELESVNGKCEPHVVEANYFELESAIDNNESLYEAIP